MAGCHMRVLQRYQLMSHEWYVDKDVLCSPWRSNSRVNLCTSQLETHLQKLGGFYARPGLLIASA